MFMLQKKLITSVSLTLALQMGLLGCSTIPSGVSFPTPPAQLVVPPNDSDLVLLPEDKTLELSQIVDSAKNNYATGYGYKVQLQELINWLEKQKENFNSK